MASKFHGIFEVSVAYANEFYDDVEVVVGDWLVVGSRRYLDTVSDCVVVYSRMY